MVSADGPFILAFGNSLTAGYGLHHTASFASQLERVLRTSHVSATVDNAGVSGDTTEDGLRRLPRLLGGFARRPDLAIVELGANDFLRGVPPARTRNNLDAILREFSRCGIPTLLATFEAPAFLEPLKQQYDGIYAELAAEHEVARQPFFPAGVFGHPELVLADGLHPNARAIEIVAKAFSPAVLAALNGRIPPRLARRHV